jgi:hypothetical protein
MYWTSFKFSLKFNCAEVISRIHHKRAANPPIQRTVSTSYRLHSFWQWKMISCVIWPVAYNWLYDWKAKIWNENDNTTNKDGTMDATTENAYIIFWKLVISIVLVKSNKLLLYIDGKIISWSWKLGDASIFPEVANSIAKHIAKHIANHDSKVQHETRPSLSSA